MVVDLPEENGTDDESLKDWITEVCNNVLSSAFNSFTSDRMTYEQTKIFCSQEILKNIYSLSKEWKLTQSQMELINEHIEEKIVPYMQKKYPLTESIEINKTVDSKIKKIDQRYAIENDFLKKSGIVFTFRESGNYNDLIMRFLNFLIT